MKRCVLILFLLAAYTLPAQAQLNTSRLTVQASIVSFPNPAYDTVTLTECSFSVLKNEFKRYSPDSASPGTESRVFAQLDVLDSTGTAVDSGGTYFSFEWQRGMGDSPMAVFNKVSLLLHPGTYSMRLTVIDVVSKRKGEVFFPRIAVPAPAKESPSIGGVIVAADVSYVGEDNEERMVKNGIRIVPNPLSLFTIVDSVVSIYCEVYNLSYAKESPSSHRLSYQFLAEDGMPAGTPITKERATAGSSAVIAERMSISGLRVGSYTLSLSVTDLATGMSATALAPFKIIMPLVDAIGGLSETFSSQAATGFDSLALEDRVRIVMYLLPPEQRATLTNLSVTGQESFLAQYWRDLEARSAIGTTVPTTRQELFERFKHANQWYSTNDAHNDGYRTDRGRVWVVYGQPEEIDDYPAPKVGNPFQIWHYRQLQEGKFFIFEDRTGIGDFQLVHSNVKGEKYSDLWQSTITELIRNQEED